TLGGARGLVGLLQQREEFTFQIHVRLEHLHVFPVNQVSLFCRGERHTAFAINIQLGRIGSLWGDRVGGKGKQRERRRREKDQGGSHGWDSFNRPRSM